MKKNNYRKNKVILGLSGGVDSTAAALLLKDRGFEVVGYFFDITGNNIKELQAAEMAAKELNIKLITEDVSKEFSEIVISNFCGEYSNARTPNPCIICNPNIKFKKLLEVANREGAYYIATGHYAGIQQDKNDDLFHIRRGVNEKKDQSYMLYRLDQSILSRLIFPLGEIKDKEDIRKIVRQKKLSNSEKKDSQEICFVPSNESYVDYLMSKGISKGEGNFIDESGNVLGKHKGIINYTIGQRKGLGISLGKPAFVTNIDASDNTVTLGEEKSLFRNVVTIEYAFFTDNTDAKNLDNLHHEIFPHKYMNLELYGKTRYASPLMKCRILSSNKKETIIKFEKEQKSITPGQSIVLYHKDIVIGGGFIKK